MNDIKFPIMESLPEGENNAIQAEQLMRIFKTNSHRELQKLIAIERKKGALILSSSKGGYYTSTDRAEIEKFIRLLEHKGKNTLAALKSAKRYIKALDGQLSIEDIQKKIL